MFLHCSWFWSSCFCPCYIAQEDLTEKILKQEDSFNDKNSESFKDQIIKQEGNFKGQIKKHEDNIEFLNSQSNRLTESVVDLQSMFRNSSMYALVLFPGIIHHFDLWECDHGRQNRIFNHIILNFTINVALSVIIRKIPILTTLSVTII